METIVKAVPLADYKIAVRTSSGVSGIFDVKPYLKGSAFQELVEASCFRLVRPTHHGISWPHEQDFSADTIIHDIEARADVDGHHRSGADDEPSAE